MNLNPNINQLSLSVAYVAPGGRASTNTALLNIILSSLKPVDFKDKADLIPDQQLAKKHFVVISVEEIIAIASSKKLDINLHNGKLFIFNSEYWVHIDEKEVKNFLGKASELLGVYKIDAKHFAFKDDLYKQFISSSYLTKIQKRPNEVLINLLNGTFSITSQSQHLRPFQKEDFLTYQLPFEFDKSATAPIFNAYLTKVLPDQDQQAILAEFAAYVFISRDTLKLEKALVLYGSGANGKSVFFEILTALLGEENVCNYSLKTLTDRNGYFRAMLANKLLNYAPEISTEMDSTIFKQLISGEPIETRLPHKEPFILKDYAKFIFNANELPRDVEENEAFFRRFTILKFEVTIPAHERDPELATKIIRNELPGVFNWILSGLKRLLLQKSFTQSDAANEAVKTYKAQSDTLQIFLTEELLERSTDKFITLKNLWSLYKKSCLELGYSPCTFHHFPDRLRSKGFHIERKNFGNVVYIAKKNL